jgi:DNA-binding Lrp family transcriptional regulator
MNKLFDKIDIKLLRELDINSRQPISQIAKKIRVSKNVVNYRINNLLDKKIISKFCTVENIPLLGYSKCRFYIKFNSIHETLENNFVAFLEKQKNIWWAARTDNEFDFSFVLLYKNMFEIKKLNSNITYAFGADILSKEISLISDFLHLRNNFIYEKLLIDNSDIWASQSTSTIDIDNIDRKIIQELKDDSRKNIIDLSKKIKLTTKSTLRRLRKLEKEKVIIAYRYTFNRILFEFKHYRVMLDLCNVDSNDESKITEYLRNCRSVILIEKTIGKWYIEFELIVKDEVEVFSFMQGFRKIFHNNIKTSEMIVVHKPYPINTIEYD